MESPNNIARKTHQCRTCGLPMKGHPRGLCGSPAGTPERERERSVSSTPQAEVAAAAEPRPIMPGQFDNQRPSEVFIDTPLINRIGPRIDEGSPIRAFCVGDGFKQEELDDGVDFGSSPRRIPRGGFNASPGPSRRRHASTPLRQLPTVLTNSYDTVLPEHSISNARIRRFSANVETEDSWNDPNRPLDDGGSTSPVSDAHLRLNYRFRVPPEDSSDTQSITWSEALRQSSAKPLAIFYTIPTRFGTYLQSKVRRAGGAGAGAAVFPLGNEEPTNQQAILATGNLDFIQQIQPHRNVAQQEYRQRTPARSLRSPTPAASPVNRGNPGTERIESTPAPQQDQTVARAHGGRVSAFVVGVLLCLFGIFVGVCLTLYILLHLGVSDFDGGDS